MLPLGDCWYATLDVLGDVLVGLWTSSLLVSLTFLAVELMIATAAGSARRREPLE